MTLNTSRAGSFVLELLELPVALVQRWRTTLPILAPYLPTFISFLAFIRWNGGIVLGPFFLLSTAPAPGLARSTSAPPSHRPQGDAHRYDSSPSDSILSSVLNGSRLACAPSREEPSRAAHAAGWRHVRWAHVNPFLELRSLLRRDAEELRRSQANLDHTRAPRGKFARYSLHHVRPHRSTRLFSKRG